MAGPWEKYAQQPAQNGPWEKYGAQPAQQPAEEPGIGATIKQESSALDAPNAVATGYNRGLAALAGLPVDTIMNVVDLGKAAIGAPYTAITGDTPDALQVNPDRSGIVGSRDWLLRQARKTGVGRAIVDPMNPEYEGGYLQAAGGGLTAVMNPNSRAQLVNQGVLGLTGALGSKATYDATGNQALAITAGMLPTVAQQGITGATKRIIRGGEAGRKAMEQRVQDLRNAGINEPTLGLASGNETIGGVENILQSTPGAVRIMRQARDKAVGGLQAKTEAASASAAGTRARGNTESGNAIRSDIRGQFLERFNDTQRSLYDRLDQYINAGDKIGVQQTEKALRDLTSIDPASPAMSAGFVNSKIQDIRNRFDMDVGNVASIPGSVSSVPVRGGVFTGVDMMGRRVPVGTSTRLEQYTTPGGVNPAPGSLSGLPAPQRSNPFSGLGVPNSLAVSPVVSAPQNLSRLVVQPGRIDSQTNLMGERVPVGPVVGSRQVVRGPTGARSNPLAAGSANMLLPEPELPYGALKRQRTSVGEQLSNELLSGAPDAQWKRLYAGMSDDMRAAADAAGPDASGDWKRANDYTKAGMGRLERIGSFSNKDATPEAIYSSLTKAAETGSSTLQAVKKSLSKGTRGQIAGTLIEQLGKAANGRQNADGDVWSPETFLTNWNKIKSGRQEILSGFDGADAVRRDIEAVAKATSMMRDSSKMWANPSGTAANLGARATLTAIGGGFFLDPALAAAAGGGVLSANLLARGLTNKASIEAATRRNAISDSVRAANARLMAAQSEDRKKK